MRKFLILLPFLLILAGCGGTGTDFTQSTLPVDPAPQSLLVPVDATQGATLRLQNHALTIPASSLSQSTSVSLSTASAPSVQPADPDFRAFGTHLVVSLGSTDVHHQGLTALLPPPELELVPKTSASNVFPVQIAHGIFIPLESTTRADGSREVKIVADTSQFEVGYVEGLFDYPAHVSWGSYNGYWYNPASGQFELFVSLGQVTGTVPNLGARPCMMVHGLGSSIRNQEFTAMAQYLLDNGTVTGVVGFEYDTLDSISTNGGFLAQFYALCAATNPGLAWRHVGHSMGCLVSREAIEKNALAIPATGNLAAFLCGPHTGSGAINILQGNLDLFQRVVKYFVINDFLDFTNSDGQRCEVSVQDPGFVDLADGSAATRALNQNAAQNHPNFAYNTLAGDARGFEFDFADDVMGQDFDDGLVDIVSANFTGLGQLQAVTEPVNHTEAVTSAQYTFPDVLDFLTP